MFVLGETEDDGTPWNVNVNPVFYDRAQLTRVWEDPKNTLEVEWRRRILMTRTPQGNVIMFYDAYKEGFAYYSDQTSISYRVLNTVALKYVKQYRCRDFFVDETLLSSMPLEADVLPRMRTNPSKMIQHKRDEEKKEQDKKNQTMQSLLANRPPGAAAAMKFDANSPFIKPKSKGTEAANVAPGLQGVPNTKGTEAQKNEKTEAKGTECHMKNRFLYLGKIQNWTPLQLGMPKPKIPVLPPSSTTNYDALFSKEMLSQKNAMDYQTYKKALQTATVSQKQEQD
jgi:hypothetical protein